MGGYGARSTVPPQANPPPTPPLFKGGEKEERRKKGRGSIASPPDPAFDRNGQKLTLPSTPKVRGGLKLA